MSQGEHAHHGHAATNGDVAKYLEAENPNAPVDELADRFELWRNGGELPPVRANSACPECNSSDLFFTDRINIARCDRCGLKVAENYDSADEWLAEH